MNAYIYGKNCAYIKKKRFVDWRNDIILCKIVINVLTILHISSKSNFVNILVLKML